MNHGDKGKQSEKKGLQDAVVFSLCFCVSVVIFVLLPSVIHACPRCVDATPYKSGMQLAVVFLLPIPLGLGAGLFLWLRKAARNEDRP